MKHKKSRKRLPKVVAKTLVALIFSVFFLLPIVLTITNSFMSSTEISANYGKVFSSVDDTKGREYIGEKVNLKFIPDMVSFEQYWNVLLKSPDYLLKFWNSVLYVVPITVFQLVVASLAAYSFTRFSGKKKTILFFAYIVLMLMPYQVTLVPNYLVSKWLHILNTRWAVWLPGIMSPFSVYLLTKFMKRIPTGIIEAAKMDGASNWQLLKSVTIPMVMPSITICTFLTLTNSFKLFDQNLALTAGEPSNNSQMLALNIFETFYGRTGWEGVGQAKAVIFFIIVAVIALAQNRLTRTKEVQQ